MIVEKQVGIKIMPLPKMSNVIQVSPIETNSKEFIPDIKKKRKKKKHKTSDTSLLAYAEVLENLGERQEQVFEVIRRLRSCNNLMIQKELGLPINSITPRVNELRELGVVRLHKRDICPYTGRKVKFWKPLWWGI